MEEYEQFIRKKVKWDKGNELKFQITESDGNDENPYDDDDDESDSDDDDSGNKFKHKEDNYKYVIKLYGVTEEGYSVSVKAEDFHPFFYVRLPDKWKSFWTTAIINYIRNKSYCRNTEDGDQNWHKFDQTLVEYKEVGYEDIYGFSMFKKYKFLKLVFRNKYAMQRCSSLFKKKINLPLIKNNKPIKYVLYESNLEPLLRFFHINELLTAGWVNIKNYRLNNESKCQIDVVTKWTNISRVDSDKVAPIRQASFDIECTSSDGSFPQAKRGDPVIQIATTFQTAGEKETFLQHIVTLKKCLKIPGVVVESFDTEEEMLEAWSRMIRHLDPDVIIGYNIYKFDLEYIGLRAEILGLEESFFDLGRENNRLSKLEEKKLSSAAYGDNIFNILMMSGRLLIDLFPVIKKDHKLISYKLDAVAEHFLKEHKLDLPPKEIFRCYHEGTPEAITKIAEYCIQDTLLPQRIMNKLNSLTTLIEMAKVTYVPISYLILRGQGIKIFSLVAKYARDFGYVIPTIKHDNDEEDESKKKKFKGATVLTAMQGYHEDPVSGLDFTSLYPTIMIDNNLCFTSFIIDEKYFNLPNVEYITKNIEGTDYHFVQTVDGILHESVLPKILTYLLSARRRVKAEMKVEKDPFMASVLDAKQLAFKVVCNSVYGFTGAEKGMIPCKPLAATVTTIGREQIELSKNFAEDPNNFMDIPHYSCTVVYGDSVTGDTPILCKINDKILYMTIDSINDGTWNPYHGNKEANEVKDIYVYTERGFTKIKRVIRHKTTKKLYRITTPIGCVDVTEDHSLLDTNAEKISPKDCTIGTKLLHTDLPINAKCVSISNHKIQRKMVYVEYVIGKLNAANKFLEMTEEGYTVTVEASIYSDEYCLIGIGYHYSPSEGIENIVELPFTEGYVYDLETENHHFQAGVGRMIVHNTDSIYCKFNTHKYESDDPNAEIVEATITERVSKGKEVGLIAAKRISKMLRDRNRYKKNEDMWTDLLYEKVYYPLILYTKKRYSGRKYEDDVTRYCIENKGNAITRRNTIPFVKTVYQSCLDVLMTMEIKTLECRVELAKGIVREAIHRLLAREVELKDLTVSKSLKSPEHYKNKKNDKDDIEIMRILSKCSQCKSKKDVINFLNCMNITYKDLEKISQKYPYVDDTSIRINLPSISHLKLAQRMAEREPGSEPKPGDRMGMVYVEVKDPKAKQSERVEDPTYAIEHNLKLDVKYYFDHEFQVPITELFALLMNNPGSLYEEEVRKFNNKNVGQMEISQFFQIKEKVNEYMKYVKLEVVE